ncbi:hypothetical protein ES332_D05G352400v1 [Gossypium tomentosum]|nr:hypothetical protein ES332_D05G352400v1 [Gossypium tomentosum]
MDCEWDFLEPKNNKSFPKEIEILFIFLFWSDEMSYIPIDLYLLETTFTCQLPLSDGPSGKGICLYASCGVGHNQRSMITTPFQFLTLASCKRVQANMTMRIEVHRRCLEEKSVYSVGCGLGGKLGHGSRMDEKHPRLIEQFRLLNLQPMVVATGAWHAAVVARDGSVCTWGWGRYGCLGHGNEECESVPKVVEALIKVKAVHVATGDYTTFVLSEDGDVYSFGCGESASLGHNTAAEGQGNRHANVLSPELVKSLKQVKEKVVQISQISLTNSIHWNAHTFALTESGKLYAFGAGDKGQLGVELMNNQTERVNPERVDIDLE